MQQVDDPPSLQVGTEVSAKYKGAFCEAKVSKVVRNIKVKVAYKQGLGSGIVSDDAIKAAPGQLRVGAVVEVRHPERKEFVEATVTKIQDCSQYTVVFDDGDITTLRRTALCLKSGRHFNESETLDQLPLTHPEHFGNPVVGGRRGRRRGHANEDSSEEEDETDVKELVNEKEENIGKIVCVEIESKKKDKDKWFPGLVVAPTAQATVRIRVKDEYLVRSFKDGRYYTVPKKEANEFTRETAAKEDGPAVQAALEYLDSDVLPPHWDRDELFGLSNSSSEEEADIDSDSSDDEPREEKDRFVAQLYKYMDDRGTPLNKVPSIQSRDIDLYRLFRAVQKRGGYNRVTAQNQWKPIALRLGFTTVTVSVANLVKQAYKKFLQPYVEFHRKLGCSMIMTSRNTNRSKGRSLVRANSVASPKPAEIIKDIFVGNVKTPQSSLALVSTIPQTSTAASQINPVQPSTPASSASLSAASGATASQSDESENTSESSTDIIKNKRKTPQNNNKVKGLIEKFEEKVTPKDDNDVPLSKIKVAVSSARATLEEKEKDKDKEKEKDKEKDRDKELIKELPSTQSSRDASPTSSTTSFKKEKPTKKQIQTPTEEKRGKRKKDESAVVEKGEVADFMVELGDKLKVYYHEKKVTYEAKVIEITIEKGPPMYLVHYTGWNNRYDEWVPRERIAENLTKGYKQKGRISSTDKQRENPPKPPMTISSMSNTTVANISPGASSNTATATKTLSSASKRGRGRSDSMPPRSTTPSSVASNSSRTKSPASSAGLKKRQTRIQTNTMRRISANISDVSVPTDTDTDSDEPVRRPTRAAKETPFKSGPASGKTLIKGITPISATNSQSETDDEENIAVDGSTTKGRDYDLNQIRSELKGFQSLKSPPTQQVSKGIGETKVNLTTDEIKTEKDLLDCKSSTTATNLELKEECKQEIKVEQVKTSVTDISSEADSFADDDSQSSDKTTMLENMTKKFQLKINADKQRTMEKQPINKTTRVVEKIIKNTLAEKRQESLKVKPNIKEETKVVKVEAATKLFDDPVKKSEVKDSNKLSHIAGDDASEDKLNVNTTPRFVGTSSSNVTSKYTSVIVEKPQGKQKLEPAANNKRIDLLKRSEEISGLIMQSKKLNEPTLKIEPPAAGSPSSTSSSSSSMGSPATISSTTRSLPDMSKLDISGSSGSSSFSGIAASKESKIKSSTINNKPTSPDVYEFKDPEPFEFEMRKSLLPVNSGSGSSNSNTNPTTNLNIGHLQASPRKQTQKITSNLQTKNNESDHPTQTPSITSVIANPMAAIVNRKRRGSPMKEASAEKLKQAKGVEEKLSPLVADAKLLHPSIGPSTTTTTTPTSNLSSLAVNTTAVSTIIKSSTSVQSKVITANPAVNVNILAPPTPLLLSSSSIGHHISSNQSQMKTDPVANSSSFGNFDALRKSPSFNLNINALNEELAQTVQETTRALTDALQMPSTPLSTGDTSPIKLEPSPLKATITKNKGSPTQTNASPRKPTTPPNMPSTIKKTVGSPFVETRRDLSNVFELSCSESSSLNSESKDNKFELENVKILLSASVGGFDLEPSTKYESKPASIADKVLKAISQKKEEVENKSKEKDDESSPHALKQDSVFPIGSSTGPTKKLQDETFSFGLHIESGKLKDEAAVSGSSLLLSHNKMDITPSSSTSVFLQTKSPIANATANSSTSLASSTPLTSPESKLGILESITVKNNDLSETIQKLECAIQRKTPVAGLSTVNNSILAATPSLATSSHFSDDSEDSTDSEQRLVIEDINDEISENNQKGHERKIGLPVKLDTGNNVKLAFAKGNTEQNATTTTIAAPIPIKGTACQLLSIDANAGKPLQSGNISLPSESAMKLEPKLEATVGSSTHHSSHIRGGTADSKFNEHLLPKLSESDVNQMQGSVLSTKKSSYVQMPTQALQSGVPIVVPEIPVSVVVAPSAVPSLVAAAHQAVVSAYHNPKSPVASEQQKSQPVPSIIPRFGSKFLPTNPNQQSMQSSSSSIGKNLLNTIPLNTPGSVYNLPKCTSGFYLDPRSELRPDDGVKPIVDADVNIAVVASSSSTSLSTTATSIINPPHDAQIESINLLCEETIPGSPAPAFGGKEETPLSTIVNQQQNISKPHHQPQHRTSNNMLLPSTSGSIQTAIPTSASVAVNRTTNSSPNDSAEDSGEDSKKNLDIENEVTSRKRRRTRKQSEMLAGPSATTTTSSEQQQHIKRRRPLVCPKRNNPGSDSDDNSDNISQRSATSTRQQHQQIHHQQQQLSTLGIRPCPYNFLVQLDPSLSPDQCIAILLKQIQDLRKTYNMIKGDLASIDRRRKKLRRREREKKQQLQNQQQIKINT